MLRELRRARDRGADAPVLRLGPVRGVRRDVVQDGDGVPRVRRGRPPASLGGASPVRNVFPRRVRARRRLSLRRGDEMSD